jgi:hypothetical protein
MPSHSQVVEYRIGDHTEIGALQLRRRIPHDSVRSAFFSDHWQPYAHSFDPQ